MEYHKSKSGPSKRKVGGIPPVVVMPQASSKGPEQETGPQRGRTVWYVRGDWTLGARAPSQQTRLSPSVEACQLCNTIDLSVTNVG